jgi:hypothetical protein
MLQQEMLKQLLHHSMDVRLRIILIMFIFVIAETTRVTLRKSLCLDSGLIVIQDVRFFGND